MWHQHHMPRLSLMPGVLQREVAEGRGDEAGLGVPESQG
jgi:hypothetical protein